MHGQRCDAPGGLVGLTWFARESWRYLGCERGTGRWRARYRFFCNGWSSYQNWRHLTACCRLGHE